SHDRLRPVGSGMPSNAAASGPEIPAPAARRLPAGVQVSTPHHLRRKGASMPADTAAAGADGARGDFPRAFYNVIRWIDLFSDVSGKLIALSMLFLVASITYEVVARYFFHAPTIWVYEASYMVNGAAFMLGCAYALLKGAHVRTDIFWDNYTER